jgi:hypothetical protein
MLKTMKQKPNKPLIETNPYLRNPRARRVQFVTAVRTSTNVEGVSITSSQLTKSTKRASKRK